MNLQKIDKNPIPKNLEEIRLVTVLKNEGLRIPYMLKYYKQLGVDRFFIIDHFSTDGGLKGLESDPNVHIFQPKSPCGFSKAAWKHSIMREYFDGHWTVIIDPDELLVYPHCENYTLKDLASFMDYERANVLRSCFLDIYSPKLLKDAVIKEGQNPLEVLTCFDYPPVKFCNYSSKAFREYRRPENVPLIEGGILHRVTGHLLFLNKVCFFKYDKSISVLAGHHLIKGRYIKSSSIEGVVLHAKYSSDLKTFIYDDKVKNYSSHGIVYNKYKSKGLGEDPFFTFETVNSTTYENSKQLIKLGIIKHNTLFEYKGWREIISSQRKIVSDELLSPNISKNDIKIKTLISYIQKEKPKIILDTCFKAGYNSCIMLNASNNNNIKLYAVGEDGQLERNNKSILEKIFPSLVVKLGQDYISEIETIKDKIDFVFIDGVTNYVNTVRLFNSLINKVNINGIILINNCQMVNIKRVLENVSLDGFSELFLTVKGDYPLRAFRKVKDVPFNLQIDTAKNELKVFGIGLSLSGYDEVRQVFKNLNFKTETFIDIKDIDCIVLNSQYIDDIPICNCFESLNDEYNSKFIYTKLDIDKWVSKCEAHWALSANNINDLVKKNRILVYGTTSFDKDLFRQKYLELDKKILSFFSDKPDKLLIINPETESNIAKRLIEFIGLENLPEK